MPEQLDVQLVFDLGIELPGATRVGHHARRLERVPRRLSADAVLSGEPNDVFERHRSTHVLPTPCGDGLLGHQELSRERVRADLVGIVQVAADCDLVVDHGAVPHAEMTELVREREPLAGDRLISVDEQQWAAWLLDVRTCDAVQEIEDDDVCAARLGGSQHIGQRPAAAEAEIAARFSGSLRAGV